MIVCNCGLRARNPDFAKRADRVWKTSDHDVAVVQLDDFHGQDEAISLVGMIDWILVRCSDWTMIPLENVVAAAAGVAPESGCITNRRP